MKKLAQVRIHSLRLEYFRLYYDHKTIMIGIKIVYVNLNIITNDVLRPTLIYEQNST